MDIHAMVAVMDGGTTLNKRSIPSYITLAVTVYASDYRVGLATAIVVLSEVAPSNGARNRMVKIRSAKSSTHVPDYLPLEPDPERPSRIPARRMSSARVLDAIGAPTGGDGIRAVGDPGGRSAAAATRRGYRYDLLHFIAWYTGLYNAAPELDPPAATLASDQRPARPAARVDTQPCR
jgi:hypothetical protein